MDVKTIISIATAVLGYVISIIQFIKKVKTTIKDKNWAELRQLMRNEAIPLMEQAERTFDNPEEKENWVIKKLGEKTHIDFFKYKNILTLAKDIIQEICQTTKIDVNKVKVVQAKQDVVEEKEDATNGIF